MFDLLVIAVVKYFEGSAYSSEAIVSLINTAIERIAVVCNKSKLIKTRVNNSAWCLKL